MAPKRKAAATTTENEPPQTRRRTRATTAAAGASVEAPVVEASPVKKARRIMKVQEKPPATVESAEGLSNAPSATNVAARATRATATRTRKTVSKAEEAPEAGPSVPKRRGRPPKTQPPEEAPAQEEPAPSRQPPSPIPEKAAQTVPKKRGRPKKADSVTTSVDPPAKVAGGSRPTRTRRAQVKVEDAADGDDEGPSGQVAMDQAPLREASPPPPKKRGGRTKKIPAPAPRPVTPPPPQEESSDDELLMTPSKRTSVRPTTPLRTGGSRMGTPRMVLDAVEILTPKRLLNTVRRELGSPGPRLHVPPLGTPRLPPAFAFGSKHSLPPAPPSPSRLRAARPPSPEPSEAEETLREAASPKKASRGKLAQPQKGLPKVLPPHLHPLLERQKRAILQTLQKPPEVDEIDVYGEDYPPTNTLAHEQLSDLLMGTVTRGEGNSCLLIGPSGSGKTQMVERAIAALPDNPIVVRLSGYAQHNDRLAIREIAWQLAQQTGHSFLPANDEAEDDDEPSDAPNPTDPPPQDVDADAEEDENPFVDGAPTAEPGPALSVTLPPPAHLLALISMIPTLPRPTIIVLDGFDLFASHARQALLYCLLDTAQACRAGPTTAAASGSQSASGMAVVGVTARVDTINLLEKRVKSRFSGRMIRTAGPARVGHWVALARAVLGAPVVAGGRDEDEATRAEWEGVWGTAVERFLAEDATMDALRETYALARDYQILRRILTCLVLELTPSSPYPTAAKLEKAISRQRCPPRFPSLHTLPYPAVCLLISSIHAQTSGHDAFTFEMLHETFKNQVRTSQSAPVQIEGGGIGMVRCSREVLFVAFERLADLRIFQPAAAPGMTTGREFALYRSAVDRFAVKKAVETVGQLSLKKWFTKAQ
ncbi:Origin recognition complex subunit 4 [Trametes pubescens]|uniref:Origin recognition complex subunit 4 n=1 Tax=Trametes pubescens TaxID=154538 RepID=A0A1M2VV21_TRAPU|nr:Origin recognition complex subunit 4 [Trametes pubescens]